MTGWQPDICIYHGNCDDGFGAAWAIWKRWPQCEFVAGFYGKDLPDVTGKDVLFVDFSAKRPDLIKMASVAKRIVIIDHHKTAEADLKDWAGPMIKVEDVDLLAAKACTETGYPIVAVFEASRSGAVLAWDFAHGIDHNDSPPTMLAFIEDRDLWRFAFGEATKEFSAALRTYPMDFRMWDELAANTTRLIDEGKIVLRSHRANIKKLLAETYIADLAGYSVPMVNAPYHYASDTAHELLEEYPEAPFAACWFMRGDGFVQWSLRSEDDRIDVSEVASKFGGGGHRNAAGFQTAAGRGTP
jgi:oligoribonuclease NrnB/cAMP/cGMP phosphodiesterase (DHH superfamily)